MTRVLPRTLVHRGVVEAAALLVEEAVPGETEARRRVLSLWTSGARVHRLPEGWLVRLPHCALVRCDQAPGLPLVEVEVPEGRALVGMPLTPAQIRSLDPPDGAVVRLRGGAVAVDRLMEGEAEDPASWLATGEFGVVSTAPLGEPPEIPHLEEPGEAAFDTREHLRNVPPPDPRLGEVLAALGKRKTARGAARRPRTSRGGALAHWLHGLAWSLRSLRKAPKPAAERIPDAPGRTAALQGLLSRMVVASRLSRLVGRRHAAYIQRMMEMFEQGDLQEALRHAIPLSAGEPLRGLPLRRPAPRSDLRIQLGRPRSRPSVTLAPDLYTELQRIYRQAFHRLEAQERVEEAAFLLAEVLHANEEAVAFLERHGRLRLAAEMAEARDLPPGLVVRQWFLAGDRERARRIARRTGAFADAVTRLERSRQHGEARELRRLWAESLAGAGDYAAAVDVVWPLPDARDLALGWMDLAIEQGGPPAGRMLARKLAAVPEQFEKIRDKVLEILESWRAEGAATRLAFAETLLLGPATPEATTLARAAVRTIARDSGRLGARMPPARFRQLVAFAGDGALRADAPALTAQEPWTARSDLWRVDVAAPDAGTMPAHDAAFLPNGLTAVALGEAGVRLVSRSGKTVAEIDQPAHRLIVSDHGDRLLALARRGDAWRLARIDVPARRGEVWCDARVDAFVPDYDGALWFVVSGSELLAAETAAKRLGGAWGVPDLPGSVLSLARSPSRCSLLLGGDEPQVWTYELPSLTLRRRDPVSLPPDWQLRAQHFAVTSEGGLVEQAIGFDADARPVLRLNVHGRFDLDIPLPGEKWASEPAVTPSWIASPVHSAEGTRVYLTHVESARVRLEVALGRTARVTLRLTPREVTLSDDRGRVLVLDLEYGLMRRDLRL
jgi:MoxR-vWA-beta-propeller ternary system domain bpX6